MPRGHAPKRETKKPKKKAEKKIVLAPPVFTSADVDVVPRRKKPREEEE